MGAVVVLLSGGLDSSTLLHYVAKRLGAAPIHALSFSYGQKHICELEMARWQAAQLEQVTEHQVSDISFMPEFVSGTSALVAGGSAVPELSDIAAADRLQPPTYVPNRNMILLALTAAFAEGRGCQTVYYGAQAHDEYGYWDCTAEFLERLNQVFALNRKKPVRIEAPFIAMRKAEEVNVGVELGVDFSHTWSCYCGGDRHCGICPTCVERRRAFVEAGVPDPTRYNSDPE